MNLPLPPERPPELPPGGDLPARLARRIDGLAGKILRRVRPGDIVLLHDVRPGGENDVARWLREIESVLDSLAAKDLRVVSLDALIGRPVMEAAG